MCGARDDLPALFSARFWTVSRGKRPSDRDRTERSVAVFDAPYTKADPGRRFQLEVKSPNTLLRSPQRVITPGGKLGMVFSGLELAALEDKDHASSANRGPPRWQ